MARYAVIAAGCYIAGKSADTLDLLGYLLE